jgi:hypothetical protein
MVMNSYPTFAQIRAERAAREIRGVVLPFQPPVQKEVAAENVLASTWGDLWGQLFDFWEDVCLDTLDVVRHTALAALDGNFQAQERNRQAEAEYTGRLIREVTGDE